MSASVGSTPSEPTVGAARGGVAADDISARIDSESRGCRRPRKVEGRVIRASQQERMGSRRVTVDTHYLAEWLYVPRSSQRAARHHEWCKNTIVDQKSFALIHCHIRVQPE